MSIPVYVLTGFLDSGKTTFLNNLLNSSGNAEIEKLVIQFEMGENEFNDKFNSCHLMKFTKKNLDKNLQVIADEIKTYIDKCKIDEIWIEWNSVTNFSKLQNLLIHKELYEDCHIKKVMHIADGNSLKNLIGKTGTALLEQIASSDFVIARNIDTKDNHDSVKIAVTSINPGVKVYDIEDFDIVYKQIFKKKE